VLRIWAIVITDSSPTRVLCSGCIRDS
jgi:hypothetical protein